MSTCPRINPVAVLAVGLFGLVIAASIDQMNLTYAPMTFTVIAKSHTEASTYVESNPLHTINPAEPLMKIQTQDAEYTLTVRTPDMEQVSFHVSEATFSDINTHDQLLWNCAYGRLSHRLYC